MIVIAGVNVIKRHELIRPAIGYFAEEEQGYNMAKTLIFTLPAAVISATILDVVLVFSYMKWIHPWSKITQLKQDITTSSQNYGKLPIEKEEDTTKKTNQK